MANTYDYDLVTIGAGSGGTRASRLSAAVYKQRVAVIELPFNYVASDQTGGAGGTCVIRGCVPKKLMVYGAEFHEEFEDATHYGWQVDSNPQFNWNHMVQKKDEEIKRLNKIYTNLLKNSGCEYIEGYGKILDPHTVAVTLPNGTVRKLTTKNILIAVGGKAHKLDIPGAEHAIISDNALVLDTFPTKGVAIIGAGYIAVEFAGIFRGFGAEVHLMYRKDMPLRGFDGDVRAAVVDNLKSKGLRLHPHTYPTRIEKGDGFYTLVYTQDGDAMEHRLDVSAVFMATGRTPRTSNLGLESVGVALDPTTRAIVVDQYSRTNVPSIFAIGDVTDRMALTPVALMEAKALVKTMWLNTPTVPDYHEIPTAVFCQPPVGTVGLTEEAAVETLEGDIDVYVTKFRALKQTLTGREEKTMMKMLVHVPTDRVVGVHMVGAYAGEIMTPMAVALKCGATKKQFDETVGVHPSSSEEFVTLSTKTRTVVGKGKWVGGRL